MTLFDEYGAYHTDPRNRLCHEIGIPLIVLGVAALLRMISIGPVNFGEIAVIATIAYYVWLVRGEALVAAAGLVALYLLGILLTWPWAVAAFVAGWIFQFIGHVYEGKKPAFLTNLVHLLVGPLWVAHILVRRRAS
jgi:uncharacterized membrane protein YGL010W